MSVINQVLNELEKRGADTSLGEPAIRVVPPHRQSHLVRYALLGATLLTLLAAGWWFLGRGQQQPGPERPVVIAAPAAALVPAPASAVTLADAGPMENAPLAGASGVTDPVQSQMSLHGKPLLEVGSEETSIATEAKPKVRHRPERATRQLAEAPADLPIKKVSPQQRAENEFGKANQAAQEGRVDDALAGYEATLLIDSSHKEARRAWVGLLLGLKRNDEAERVLQRGLKRDPHDTSFAMLLARLQVERNDVSLALETLQKALPDADGQADYQAFVAALLQRQSRHDEAITHYQVALKLAPNNGIWLMGLGISLQVLQRNDAARDAYQRALATNSLSAQLQAYVQGRLKEL